MFHRTERLLLRPAWPEDWRAIFKGIAEQGIVCNLARAPWPYTEDHAREFAARLPADPRIPSFMVTLPGEAGSRLIGAAGLGMDDRGELQIGYWIAREHWGRGYATEAARAVVDIARALGHRRIVAGHFQDNPASGRVLQKAGFVPTGEIRPQFSAGRGAEAPLVCFAIDLDTEPERLAA
ncbi:GNAT family N-acetyltransferase [Qipengyuania sp. JC766]|uniref:GNAT family N-acetyltransferase n=1 Tax=Qipengyuania sp. JC766 TaxID=3232139 RepID=UPI00345AF8F8